MDFLTALGLDCGEPMTVGDKWVERIIDLPDPQAEAVIVRFPAGASALEVVNFHALGAETSTDSRTAGPRAAAVSSPAMTSLDPRGMLSRHIAEHHESRIMFSFEETE